MTSPPRLLFFCALCLTLGPALPWPASAQPDPGASRSPRPLVSPGSHQQLDARQEAQLAERLRRAQWAFVAEVDLGPFRQPRTVQAASVATLIVASEDETLGLWTTASAVAGAARIFLAMPGGEEIPLRLVASADDLDLALLVPQDPTRAPWLADDALRLVTDEEGATQWWALGPVAPPRPISDPNARGDASTQAPTPTLVSGDQRWTPLRGQTYYLVSPVPGLSRGHALVDHSGRVLGLTATAAGRRGRTQPALIGHAWLDEFARRVAQSGTGTWQPRIEQEGFDLRTGPDVLRQGPQR